MAKHKVYKTNPLRKYIILSLFIFLFIGMGYSVLSTSLGIGGNITVWKHDQTLYGVLEYEARKGTYAKKYTGEHQDSMNASLSNKEIYHWYANNETTGNAVKDKYNVLFANQCWLMLRTTDTGGVKLLYNGEAVDGKCLDNRNNHIGYNYISRRSLTPSNYWYGDSYEFDSNNNVFTLSGTKEQVVWNESNSQSLIGKYTCLKNNEYDTCSSLYLVYEYIDSYNTDLLVITSNSNYSVIGKLPYYYIKYDYSTSSYENTTKGINYMYNDDYPLKEFDITPLERILSSSSINTSYWYFDDVVWGSPVANKYNSVNQFQITNESDYSNLIGKYTFNSTSIDATSATANYIVDVNGSNYYYIQISSGNNLNYYLNSYTYGDSFIENGNGTYTVNNPTTFGRTDWLSNYNNLNGKYICKNAVNNTCSSIWRVYRSNNVYFTYEELLRNYVYSNGVSYVYDNDLGSYKYVLSQNPVSFWNITNNTNREKIKNAHYSCFNNTGECSKVYYIYEVPETNNVLYRAKYMELSDGDTIETALNKAYYADSVNAKNSVIKQGVDSWYKQHLLDYDQYIDDTIYCNDRSIKDFATSNFNPNGGAILSNTSFGISNDIKCYNQTDSFSISNPKAKLTYKIGLMTLNELKIMYSDSAGRRIISSPVEYWLGSPAKISGVNLLPWTASTQGSFHSSYASDLSEGVKPSISLKAGTIYNSGDGSMANPYVVSTN